MLVTDMTGQVVVRITHRLQLTHDTEHLVHLVLGLVGQTTVSYIVQVLRNLVLHAVTDTFVFLDTREDLGELRLVFLVEQVMYHAHHTLCTHGKDVYLFPCLQDRQLGRGHQTTGDEPQLTVRIFLFRLGRNDENHQFLQPLDEPDQDTGVDDVERRVERSQDGAQFDRIHAVGTIQIHTPPTTYHRHKRTEDTEHPDHTEQVENQVCHSRTSRLYRCRHGYYIGGDGRTDVLTEHQRDTHIYRQHTYRAQRHRNSHDGGRRLHSKGQHTAD